MGTDNMRRNDLVFAVNGFGPCEVIDFDDDGVRTLDEWGNEHYFKPARLELVDIGCGVWQEMAEDVVYEGFNVDVD